MIRRTIVALLAVTAVLSAAERQAHATLVVTGASGIDTAEADFTVTGSVLTIRLKNTSSTPNQIYGNADLLSAVFFDVNGSTPTLNTATATVTAPTGVTINGATCAPSACTAASTNMAGEWAYKMSPSGFTSTNHILSTTDRYGLAGTAYAGLFTGAVINSTAPHYISSSIPPDGLGFTIAGSNYNPASSFSPASPPLVQNEIDFTFNFTGTLTEAMIYNVTFGYGAEPNAIARAPEPASVAILGAAWVGLRAIRGRRRRV